MLYPPLGDGLGGVLGIDALGHEDCAVLDGGGLVEDLWQDPQEQLLLGLVHDGQAVDDRDVVERVADAHAELVLEVGKVGLGHDVVVVAGVAVKAHGGGVKKKKKTALDGESLQRHIHAKSSLLHDRVF
jgi:hypothetical protein